VEGFEKFRASLRSIGDVNGHRYRS